jgi:DNA repair protein SbcC/Rad50
VRPLRLEIEGLTSFRERVVLDFEGLDLFAITGATGAGKSSLIDAMVLALYGQVPRVSGQYKQLISHGAERMSVRFDFRVGNESYRVARTVRAAGTPAFRLERLTAKGAEPVADREKDVVQQVERIVGLDYDAFVRAVVLPQGQFDAFLKGKPEERRKILVTLLNLKVYEDMHAIVNRRAADARRESEYTARTLGTDFANVSIERLEQMQGDLSAASSRKGEVEAAAVVIAEALPAARALREARREVQRLEEEAQGETQRAAAANAALQKAARRQAELAQRARAFESRAQTAAFDEERLLALSSIEPRAEQLVSLEPRLQKLENDAAAAARAVAARQTELAAADAALPALEKAEVAARAAVDTVRAERDDAHRRHAAHALRRDLAAGEPCPVCEQVVRKVPSGKAPALDTADRALRAAEAAARAAGDALQQARLAAERLRADAAGQQRSTRQLDEQRDDARASVRAVRAALADAGFAPAQAADAKRLLDGIAAERSKLEKARGERDRIEKERRQAESDRLALEQELTAARTQAEDALQRLQGLQARQAKAGQALEKERQALLLRARKEEWGALDQPLLGRDELDVLEARQVAMQRECAAASAAIARLTAESERLAADLARVEELRAKKKALDAEAALGATLAQHLQANQFIAYVQEEALRTLAADGSLHLNALSQGRYSLGCADQDFHVVDHWNADRQRSVKTLSGGETFLASLALALALAERLADLAAEGHAGDRLESLFLDEGFGTLDADTLDVVVQAIETLQGGNRLVGVVTHIAELAERLPARVTVSGGQGVPATLTVS